MRVEELTHEHIPEGKVDVIVSEPLGTFLLNERMLETYVIARQLFLKPGGRMFPSRADLCIVPFSDSDIYNEQLQKCEFWRGKDFYGLDLSELYYQAVAEKFSQPVLDTYDANKNLADKPYRKTFDFENCSITDL
jgi:histone-arginine methyltransferase CARM1